MHVPLLINKSYKRLTAAILSWEGKRTANTISLRLMMTTLFQTKEERGGAMHMLKGSAIEGEGPTQDEAMVYEVPVPSGPPKNN